jgi:hypothetical protein
LRVDVGERALSHGFVNEPRGVHTGKTMMLPELRLQLAAVSGRATFPACRTTAVEDDVLEKASAANRKRTFDFVRQLYTFYGRVPLFAARRERWAVDAAIRLIRVESTTRSLSPSEAIACARRKWRQAAPTPRPCAGRSRCLCHG